jgi:hypothetical protein
MNYREITGNHRLRIYLNLGFDYWVILFGLIIFKLPVLIGYNQSLAVRLICLAPFILVIVKNSLFVIINHSVEFDKKIFLIFILYMSVLGISILRSSFNNYFSIRTTLGNFTIWLTFALFSFLTFACIISNAKAKYFREAIYYGLIIYVIINVLAYLLGFTNQEDLYITSRPAIMLQFFNISIFRVLFPLASGINTFGIIAGATLCISVLLFANSSEKKNKTIGLIGAGFSFYSILLTDCRGGLFFAVATIAVSVIFPTKYVKYWRWLPLIAPFLPLLYIFIQENIPLWIIQGLLRTPFLGNVDILSGRQQIWISILDHFRNFQIIHLFGYGYRGDIMAGITQEYSYLFTNFVNSDWVTGHNFVLQTIMEIGYFGLFIVLWFISTITFSLSKLILANPDDYSQKIIFFLMFFLVLAGTTETVLTPYHQELFFIFLLIASSVGVSLPREYKPQPESGG